MRAFGHCVLRPACLGAALAQGAGVGQPTVSKVENGRMVPSSDVLERLARALLLNEATSREVRDLSA
ncbi:helix-turn-helix domain-containing protein [Streptomyces bacillaris]|uniref:helix-turn-helix domain-containing protein n=1 Tax=Streptomyces bacillaris TaxID=68179 RepID=UPI0035D93888